MIDSSADFDQFVIDFGEIVSKTSGGTQVEFRARVESVTEPVQVGDGMVERRILRLVCRASDAPNQSQVVTVRSASYVVAERPEIRLGGFAYVKLRRA